MRSILTLEPKGKSKENGSDSIIDIALENKQKEVFLVENTMSGFLDAFKNLKEVGINLNFGLRLDICPDLEDKSHESVDKTSRIIIFCLNSQGYYDLIKLHNIAHTQGIYKDTTEHYSGARIDYKTLQSLWTENLHLSVPFYDSYIHRNLLHRGQCIPEFGNIKPSVMQESNDLPFDFLIQHSIDKSVNKDWERINTKSIYYKNRKDFDAFLTYRAIQKRQTYAKPNLNSMGSREFSIESWLEQQ